MHPGVNTLNEKICFSNVDFLIIIHWKSIILRKANQIGLDMSLYKCFVKCVNINVPLTLKDTQQKKMIFWNFLVRKLFVNGSAPNFACEIEWL